MRRRTWVKAMVGLLVIGGTLGTLWAIYRPSVTSTVEVKPPPAPPQLHDAHAVVVLRSPAPALRRRATIRCDGTRRAASGFWAAKPVEACDALASTRRALLSGPGCRRSRPNRTSLHVVGAFGAQRFDHRMQHLGCPSPRAWLAVNALASPVLPPERQLSDAERQAAGP